MSHVKILLWKDFKIKLRKIWFSLSEAMFPLLFAYLFIKLYTLDPDVVADTESFSCRHQSSVSPSLFLPLSDSNVIFELSTYLTGKPGVQTIPPLVYLLALLSKTHSVLALVPGSNSSYPERVTKVLSEFESFMLDLTQDIDSAGWKRISLLLSSKFNFSICPMSSLYVRFDNYTQYVDYISSSNYGNLNWTTSKFGCPIWSQGELSPLDSPNIHIALVINDASELVHQNRSIDYTIETNITVIPPTYKNFNFVNNVNTQANSRYINKYLLSGFLTLQLLMDRFLLNDRVDIKSNSRLETSLSLLSREQFCSSFMPLVDKENFKLGSLSISTLLLHLNITFERFTQAVNLVQDRVIQNNWNVSVTPESKINQFLSCETLVNVVFTILDVSETPLTLPNQYIPNNIDYVIFPTPRMKLRPFFSKIRNFASLFFILSFSWPVSRIIRNCVVEKEKKYETLMLTKGVTKNSLYWSKFLVNLVILSLSSCLVCCVLSFGGIFKSNRISVVFLLFFLFALTITSYCLLLSQFFVEGKTASISGIVIWFLGFLPYFMLSKPNAQFSPLILKASLLLSPTAFGIGINLLFNLEGNSIGISYHTMFDKYSLGLSYFDILQFLLFDATLYCALTFIYNKIRFVSPRLPQRKVKFISKEEDIKVPLLSTQQEVLYAKEPFTTYQSHQIQNRDCIELVNICKRYSNEVVLDKINLTLFENEIFALLGPNGAGKTTLLSIISGSILQTSGSLYMFDIQPTTNQSCSQTKMGTSFQEDILFNNLSILEHLLFFSSLSGSNEIISEVETDLKSLGLFEIRHRLAKVLSGGEKRKLCLLISYTCSPRLVILDEPSAGVDVLSRRSMWKFISSKKNSRITILTTHYLSEAESISDRIGFLRKGKLELCGSLHYFRQEFNLGYTIHIVTKNVSAVNDILTSFELTIDDTQSSVNVVHIPRICQKWFLEFFIKLEGLTDTKFSVRLVGLEAVFKKIIKHDIVSISNTAVSSCCQPQQVSTAQVISYIYLKRVMIAKRDSKALVFNTLLPILLLFIGLILSSVSVISPAPRLSLSISKFSELPVLVPTFFEYISKEEENLRQNLFEDDDVSLINGNLNSHSNKAYCASELPQDLKDVQLNYCSNSLIQLKTNFSKPIFGAYSFQSRADEFLDVTIFVNSTARHGAPVFLNLLSNNILSKETSLRIGVSSKPFPLTRMTDVILDNLLALDVIGIIILSFTFVPAAVVYHAVKEKQTGFKFLQKLAARKDCFYECYWCANYIFDVMNFLLSLLLIVFLFHTFHIRIVFAEIFSLDCLAFILLALSYGTAIIPFAYLVSFFFNSPTNAQTFVLVFNFLTGYVLVIISLVLSVMENTRNIGSKLLFLFRLFPMYSFGAGVQQLCVRRSILNILQKLHLSDNMGEPKLNISNGFQTPKVDLSSPFAMDNIGWNLVYLVLESIFYFILLIYLERNTLQKVKGSRNENNSTSPNTSTSNKETRNCEDTPQELTVSNVSFRYPTLKSDVVSQVSFSASRGDVFGLLGFNGAGKTTLLNILLGTLITSSGRFDLDGKSLSDLTFGFCPQDHTLSEFLTVKEHLIYFKSLMNTSEQFVDSLVEIFKLHDYLDIEVWKISGGTKRRLQLSLALLGSPEVIILDEPTSGVDIENRLYIWETLIKLKKCKDWRSVTILTSHSINECETLCSKVAIMKSGRVLCTGNVHQLKDKYASGFVITIQDFDGTKELDILELELHRNSVYIVSSYCTLNIARFNVTAKEKMLYSEIYRIVQLLGENLGFNSFSINSSSLEEVFTSFANFNLT